MKQIEKTRHTREKILSAAMNEFGKNGYAGASLNNICVAGISKGLIYHNFKSKDDIYLACVKMCFDGLTVHLKESEIGSDIQKYMADRFDYFKTHENEKHIFFDAILLPPEALFKQIQALRFDFDKFNSEMYQKILSSVSLRKGVIYEDALQYFAMQQTMFNGYFSSPAFSEIPFDEKINIHEIRLSQWLDFMLYGIAERSNR